MSFCSKFKKLRTKSKKSSHQTDTKTNQKANQKPNHKLNSKLNRKTFFKRKHNKHNSQEKHIATKEELEELADLDWASKFFLKISGAALSVIIFGLVLAVTSGSNAANPSTDTSVTVSVPIACTISGTNQTYNLGSMSPGTLNSNVGNTSIGVYCNDETGFKIYAMGYSSQDSDYNTDLISSVGNQYNIKTSTTTTGTDSSWAMQVTSTSATNPLTILNNFDSFHTIPSTYTAVAGLDEKSATTSLNLKYQVYIGTEQSAGSFTGKVRYALVHNYNYGDRNTLAKALKDNDVATKTKDGVTYYTMQGLGEKAAAVCNSTVIEGEPSQIQLIDTRDDKLYWVTKLQDGKCWMTQNLDLDLSTSTTLTSENTDLETYGSNGYDSSNGYTCSNSDSTCTNGTISWTPERDTIATGNLSSTTWQADAVNPYSYDDGERYRDSNLTQQNSGTHGLSGNYYNWTAAIASNNSSSLTSGTPQNSICPSGWHLPVITSYTQYHTGTNDFYNLDYYYNGGALGTGTGLMNPPLYFARSGRISVGSLNDSGSRGHYWSSTVDSSSSAYYLYFSSGGVYPAHNSDRRYYGFSVRCVLDT